MSNWTFSYLVPLHCTKFSHHGKKTPEMNAMHCFLFQTLFATACLGIYICCAAGQIARSSDQSLLWSGTIIQNLLFAVRKPTKTWRHFLSKREIRCSSRAWRLAFRLPLYDSPRVAPCNNPEFHVHRPHAVGGVCEQTKTALQICIYRYDV